MRTTLCCLVIVLASALGAHAAHAQDLAAYQVQPGVGGRAFDPDVPAPVAQDRVSTNWALVGPGIGLFAAGWAAGWLTTIVWNLASAQCSGVIGDGFHCDPPKGPYGEGDWQMAIPIVGPWLTFIGDDTYRGGDIWFPVTMGIMQAVGLGALIVGLLDPRHTRARDAASVDVGFGTVTVSGTF